MPFRVLGIDPGQFSYLYELSDADLAAEGAKRYVVDSKPGFPNRVEVRDMNIGEHAILLNYEYQPADTPYRSRHAIFVREGAHRALDAIDVIPDVLRVCPISLRGFSENGEMVDANLVDGDALAPLIEQFFENPAIAYLQAHYAKRGCYAARIVPFRNDRQDGQDIPYWGPQSRTLPCRSVEAICYVAVRRSRYPCITS